MLKVAALRQGMDEEGKSGISWSQTKKKSGIDILKGLECLHSLVVKLQSERGYRRDTDFGV